MNISLPDGLKTYVDTQVSTGGFGTASEYVRMLIRQDQERTQLRAMLLAGARSPIEGEFDAAYFDGLRQCVQQRLPKAASR